jgi:predicted ester cyclase
MSESMDEVSPRNENDLAHEIVEAVRCAWTNGDTDGFARHVAPDYARVAADGSRTDLSGWGAVIASARHGFPDLEVSIEDVVFESKGDAAKLAVRWHGAGTHVGHFLGVPPTHRQVSEEGATFFDIRDGEIFRERGTWLPKQLLGALGVYLLSDE